MRKLKLFVGIGLLFVFGVLVGVFGTGLYIRHSHPPPPRGDGPGERKAFLLDRLNRELKLDDKQQKRVAEIVNRMHARIVDRFRKHHAEITEAFESGFAEIENELNPDQKPALERFRRKLEERNREMEGRLPPPPRPPE